MTRRKAAKYKGVCTGCQEIRPLNLNGRVQLHAVPGPTYRIMRPVCEGSGKEPTVKFEVTDAQG